MTPAQETRNTYDWNQATSESYWYSIYNLQALFASQMGIPLSIPQELFTRWAQEAGLTEQESTLLKDTGIAVPYSSGDSTYTQPASQKWSEEESDRIITAEAIAWWIISLSSQAKQLERLHHMGIAQSGETQLWAMLLGHVAAEAARFAYSNLRTSEDQLYVRSWRENVGVSNPSLRPLDQIWMLWALAELESLTEGFSFYRGTLSHAQVESWALELFRAITQYSQSRSNWLALNPHDTGMWIEGVSAYAAALSNGTALEEAVDLIQNSAQTLKGQIKNIAESSASGDISPVASLAEAIRALIIAQRMTGDASLRQAALEGWNSMQSLWDDTAGVYRTQGGRSASRQAPYDYSLWDIGAIAGAYGALIYGAGVTEARGQYARFFENALKISHLMIAERDEAGGDADRDAVPAPENAGGEFGRAPVFASGLQYDPGARSWSITSTRFYTAGALYLASRLLWMGQREGQWFLGPPRWGLPESKEAQLVSLRKTEDTISTKVEAIRQLLSNLEGQFRELRQQVASSTVMAEDLTNFKARLETLEQQVNDELSSLNKKLVELESKTVAPPSPAPRSRFGLPETLTVVLILFILLLGFVAYQRVLQQPA